MGKLLIIKGADFSENKVDTVIIDGGGSTVIDLSKSTIAVRGTKVQMSLPITSSMAIKILKITFTSTDNIRCAFAITSDSALENVVLDYLSPNQFTLTSASISLSEYSGDYLVFSFRRYTNPQTESGESACTMSDKDTILSCIKVELI